MADRGLQFGDGLFETIRLTSSGQAPLLERHLHRLSKGLNALGFDPAVFSEVKAALGSLLESAPAGYTGMKLIVTRGSGPRGYAPPEVTTPAFYASFFQVPPPGASAAAAPALVDPVLNVGVSHVRLGHQPLLAGLKHLNRLEQVLARQAFQPDWQEALMISQHGMIIEGCMSNVFVKIDGQWHTPSLTSCGVQGVVRDWLIDAEVDIAVSDIPESVVADCEAMVLTNSL
ncbi:MAG: aminodeoxychorismate lyase, partial [Thalassolituus sp.]